MKVFAKEKVKLQYSVLKYHIDLHLDLALNYHIDLYLGHLDRDENNEAERENKIKETLRFSFFRNNPEREKFYVFVEISKIYDIIDEISKKQ